MTKREESLARKYSAKHVIYAVKNVKTGETIYIGATSNLPNRIRDHTILARAKLSPTDVEWNILATCFGRIKAHELETRIVNQYKNSCECKFNICPSRGLRLEKCSDKWQAELKEKRKARTLTKCTACGSLKVRIVKGRRAMNIGDKVKGWCPKCNGYMWCLPLPQTANFIREKCK